MITGTHKVTGVYGTWYNVEFKNIETKQQYKVRHHDLGEKILLEQDQTSQA